MSERRQKPRPEPVEPTTDTGAPVDRYAPPTQGPAPFTPKTVTTPPEAEPDAAPAFSERVEPQQGERHLQPGRLDEHDGEGLIIVVRDAEGTVASVNGSWRPGDPALGLDDLRATFPVDHVARFEGTRIDTGNGETAEDVSIDVVVTSHGEYEFEDGGTLRIVNFKLQEGD